MNTQFTYVDANNAYVVARSSNEHNVSASPSFSKHASNYVQGPMQQNIHDSTSYNFSNMQHMYPNSHASATPQIHIPMNNMMSSVNQVETPHVGSFNGMQHSVSSFYSSATNLHHVKPNMPVDRVLGHATTSYMANYPQTSYATPHATNFSAPYAIVDIRDSAPHLHAHGRISENSTRAHVSLPSNVAYHVAPAQLQKFGNTPLPKASQSIGGQSDEDWAEIGRKKLKDRLAAMFAEFRQEQATLRIKERKSGDSDNKVNSVIKIRIK